jgi:peptidyl-prolyl cis-trans isomerase D
MLQDIRANIQGTIAKIIIGLIVVSFSIFGIESLLFSGGGSSVAEVNGEEIDPYSLQQEVSLQQRRLLSILGDNADPSMLDEGMLRDQALQVLIQREVLTQSAHDLGLAVAESALGQIIAGMPQFQIDGRFSPDQYRSALASMGFTPAMFRGRLEEDLLLGQLRAGIAGSAFATGSELELSARIEGEGRDLRYITLPLDRYRDEAQPDDQQINAYYESNADRFMSPESLVLDYLELRLDDYREPIPEERLREEFALVRDQYEQAEEARVSHILFEGDDQERASRVAEVQGALAGGLSFAEAAEQFSDDIGSRAQGGDLGYTAGDTFPAEMEEAIRSLPVGEVSAPVETDAGTHLLLVTDRRAGTAVSFDAVRNELEARLQDADAAAALLRDVERLRDLAFNAADLARPAAELSLPREVQHSAPITREQADGLFANPRLLQAAFSPDVLEAGHNSEVIEIDGGHFVVLRVAERRAPAQQPLQAVRDTVVATLRDQQAREQARADALELLRKLRAGEAGVEELANQADLDWQVELGARRDSSRLPGTVRQRLFSLLVPQDAPVHDLVTDDENLYVLEFTRVTPGAVDRLSDAQRAALRERLAIEEGNLVQRLYEDAQRASARVRVY